MNTWVGDLCGLIAAFLRAATTVLVRATSLARDRDEDALLSIGISALALPLASIVMGEPGVTTVNPAVLASLAYQGVIVAFAS